MSRNLQNVQKFAHVLQIILTIAGVCLSVSALFSFIAGLALVLLPDATELHTMLVKYDDVHADCVHHGAALLTEAVFLIGEAIPMLYAVVYLKRERADGTPFTVHGAKELFHHGILGIAIPVAALTLARIIEVLTGTEDIFHKELDITVGVIMLLVSIVLKYGAELEAKLSDTEKAKK